ncbi:hypothetical protein BLNAU_21495 [Blattamonas nauphoetae]|uniref:Uncharacterized protein n=1 Tax=Blattamonas nauphoetae TaxID=2049346 RepID=A0ABQ9X008_9EUKA|nr:hypothetical protein BLNAU_21495 [Blattamonas nauphoetae]
MTMTKLNVIPLAQCSLISLENDGEWVVLDNMGIMAMSAMTYKFNQGIFAQPLLSLFTNAEPEILLNNVTFKNLKMVEKTQDSGDTDHQDRIEWSDIIHRHNICADVFSGAACDSHPAERKRE